MSRKTGIVSLIVILGLIAGFYLYQSRSSSQAHSDATTAPKRKASKPFPVHVVTVSRGVIHQQTDATGDILAAAKVDVYSKVEGRVQDLLVEQGDWVEAGQTLAQIADNELRVKAERVAAQLEAVQAEWAQMQAGERQEDIAQVINRVQRAHAEQVNATRELQRAQVLHEKGLYATQQLDDTQLKVTQATTAHATAKKQLRLVRSGARVEDRRALQARMKAAEAELRLAKSELQNAVITSPMTGIVSHRHIDSGAYITGRTALFAIVDMQSVKIKVPISERDIGRLRPGLPAQIQVDAYPQERFAGTLKRISPTIDPTNRSGDVEITIDNSDLRLKPGMFAKITLIVQQREDVVVVPRQAVRYQSNVPSVFVVSDGKAQLRQVATGLQNDSNIEIVDHLEQGAQIILAGHHNLKDNSPVEVVQPK